MKFLVILTIFSAPTNVEIGQPLTLQPVTTLEFRNTTENNTVSDCSRVAKALTASRVTAYCSEVAPIDEPATAE